MRFVHAELVEVRTPTGRIAMRIVEQRVANTLKGLQLEDHGEGGAQTLEARAVRAVAERRILGQKVALGPQPDGGTAERRAGYLAGGLVVLLDDEAIGLSAHTDPGVRHRQEREAGDIAGFHGARI